MRSWWGLLAVVLAVHLLQTAVVGNFDWPWLDLFLATALLCCLLLPLQDARLAAWFIGLVQDIGAAGPIGVHAFSLGVAGILLTNWRARVNLNLWWGRALVAAAAAQPAVLLECLHIHYWQGNHGLSIWAIVLWSFVPAAVAALLAAGVAGLPWLVVARRRSARYRPAR